MQLVTLMPSTNKLTAESRCTRKTGCSVDYNNTTSRPNHNKLWAENQGVISKTEAVVAGNISCGGMPHPLWVASTRSSATVKSTACTSCLDAALYDISREKICWSLINHFYVMGTESYWIRQHNAKQEPVHRSRAFKVTNFSTSGKPIYDFLLMNNTNLSPILHCFWDTADYWPFEVWNSSHSWYRRLHVKKRNVSK